MQQVRPPGLDSEESEHLVARTADGLVIGIEEEEAVWLYCSFLKVLKDAVNRGEP